MANQGNILIRIGADASQYLKTMKKSTLAMMSMGRRMSSMGAEMTRAFTVPIGLAAGAAIKFAADLDSMERSLGAVMGSSEKAERELKALRKAALEPGLDFMQAVQGSIRLQSMGLSADKARLFLSGMGRAVELSAGGAAEFSRVMQQVSDIMSRGKVTMEDWKRVAQAAPAVLKAMSEEFGTTNIEAIRATMGVDEFMTRLSKHLVAMEGTGGNLKNTLNNLWTEFRVGMGVIGQSIIKTFDLQKKADDLAVAMRKLSVWIADNGETIAKWARKLGPALALLAGLGPVTRLIGNFTMALSQAKMILSTIGTPLAAVTGLTAGLAGGITVAAGATVYWWRELYKLNKELKKYGTHKLTSPLDESAVDLFSKGFGPGGATLSAGRIAAKKAMLSQKEKERADLLGVGSASDLSITGRGFANIPSAAISNPFTPERNKKMTEAAQKIKEAISDVYGAIGVMAKKSTLFGKNFDDEVIASLEKGIEKLLELGVSAESTAVQKFKSLLDYLQGLSKAIDSINTSKFEEDMLTMGAYDKWMAGRVKQLPLTLTASMGTGKYDLQKTDPNSLMGLSLAPQESFMGSLGDDETIENIEGFNEILDGVRVNMEAIHDTATFFGDAFVEGFSAATQGAKAFGDFMKRFLADLIKRLLKALVITALVGVFSGGTSTLGQVGQAFNFGKSFLSNFGIGSFAKGGLAYGPQLAMVGDNPNASVDPEVIAPLSKLKSMIGDAGGGKLNGEFVVRGRDLHLLISRAQYDKTRLGGQTITL